MTEIQPYTFPTTGQQVRTVLVDGEPWFLASDVCAALDITNVGNALGRLDDDEKSSIRLADGTPGNPTRAVINEPGLYSLIVRSDKSEARAFKRWVTHDVLPAIRTTGRYEVTPAPALPQSYAAALRELAATVERAEQAERDAQALAPAAAAWDHLASGDGDWCVADAAKILSRDPAITTGRDRLFNALAGWGWVYRGGDGSWRARQTQVDNGRLSEIPQSHYHPRTGELVLDPPQVRIKPKGLVEIHRKLGGSRPLAVQQQLAINP